MLLRLQKFNLEVGYVKGSEMLLPDILSRAPLPSTAPSPPLPTSIVPDQNTKKSVTLTWKVSMRLNSREFQAIASRTFNALLKQTTNCNDLEWLSNWDVQKQSRKSSHWLLRIGCTVQNWSVQWGAVQRWLVIVLLFQLHYAKKWWSTFMQVIKDNKLVLDGPKMLCFGLVWAVKSKKQGVILQPLCRVPNSTVKRGPANPWIAQPNVEYSGSRHVQLSR